MAEFTLLCHSNLGRNVYLLTPLRQNLLLFFKFLIALALPREVLCGWDGQGLVKKPTGPSGSRLKA